MFDVLRFLSGGSAVSDSPRILVTVATYNEIENLPALVDEIFRHVPTANILVIDDNSPDGTGSWCDERSAEEPRLSCLHREGKLGLGSATIAGMRRAIDDGYDLMLNLDADFSHDPSYLPQLLQRMEQGDAEVVIGSRYVPGGGIDGWPWQRRLISRCVNLAARCLLRLRPKDCTGALRCYRCETLQRLDLSEIRSEGYAYLEEILWRLQRQGARLVEIPIVFVDRRGGESKTNIGEALAVLRLLMRLGLQTWLGR